MWKNKKKSILASNLFWKVLRINEALFKKHFKSHLSSPLVHRNEKSFIMRWLLHPLLQRVL